jgi:hypothetical protein
MKYLCILLCAFLLTGCGGSGSGGSDGDASTYDTCEITQSDALFASDRAKDTSQCWSIKPTEDQTNALNQCKVLVNDYIANEYTFGHSVKYLVGSTSCP